MSTLTTFDPITTDRPPEGRDEITAWWSTNRTLHAKTADLRMDIERLREQLKASRDVSSAWFSVRAYIRATQTGLGPCRNGIGLFEQNGDLLACRHTIEELAEWCRPHLDRITAERVAAASAARDAEAQRDFARHRAAD